MKKVIKNFALIILSAVIAACLCAWLSACVKKDNGEKNGKWDEREGIKVGFVSEAAYNGGELDESKIQPVLSCLLNEKHYMVLDFDIQAQYDNDGRETVTAEVKIQPAEAVKATIQDTNTSTTSNETQNDITTIKATYKIPEKANTVRHMRLIIQLQALKGSEVYIDTSFKSDGEMQAVKTEQLKKTADMGYTKELSFRGNTVTGISGNTANEVVIPIMKGGNYITEIGSVAFYNCSGLKSVIIPDGVTCIGNDAFDGCVGLTSISVPDSIADIGARAFDDCAGLKYNEYGNGLYLGNQTNKYLVLVKAKDRNISFCDIIKSTKIICVGAFEGCRSLKSVTIPDGVSIIYSSTFSNCSGLTSVTIPYGVKEIGVRAFEECSKLTSIEIPDSVKSIGSSAFYMCSGLISINIPYGVTKIDYFTFGHCSSLVNVALPDSVTSIGSNAFNPCYNLTNITIPSSVESISGMAFSGCSKLVDLTFNGTVTQWKTIEKNSYWNDSTPEYVVHCTDGDLSKAES